MSSVLISNRWALDFQYYCKSSWHVAHQWMDLIISIQRSRTPFVFEICLIPLQSVLNTDSDESWHTLCVHLLNACLCLPLHAPRSLHSRGQCPNARSLSVNLSPFYPMFFSIFSLDATLKCILLAVILSRFRHHPGYYAINNF